MINTIAHMLNCLHGRVVTFAPLYVFTAITRGLLAVAFVPSGLIKLLGNRFTVLPTSTPVGFFFEALYQSGGYYRFIGLAQLLAALLLLFPGTATLGAVVYFPIILNIFVITVAINFQGTPIITGLMLLASLYLLCWDYDKLKVLLPLVNQPGPAPLRPVGHMLTFGMTLATVLGTLGLLQLLTNRVALWIPATMVLGAAVLMGGCMLRLWRGQV
ncbi:MAG: hypothetical protein MUD01_16510 [Chloroflexaceae bacterium]|jgi:hypothetical protein|nr:hypothetical protein [Chloroflexaceae bacterium]